MEIEALKTVQLNPGDTVVVKVGHYLDKQMYDQIHSRMQIIFPNNAVILIDKNTNIDVIKQ